MSALLRSIAVVRTLKNLAETSVCLRGLKGHNASIAPKSFHVHNARFFAIQHKSLIKTERDVYNHNLSNMLERLNTEGRQFGRISYNLFQDVVTQLKNSNSVSSSQALVVLRCCGALMPEELPTARTEFAHSIWETLERRGLPLDLSHYNALLRVYVENEHDFAPAEFLERLKAKNIEPNRVTYQRLIMRFAQLGDIEGATKILEMMKEQNLPINENIFHSLILGHARAGDLKNAEDMLEVMRESGLQPSVDTYLALAVAQAEQGDMNRLQSTIALSTEADEALHDRDLMEVIYGLASKGHFDHVPEIVKLLKKEWGFNQDCKNLIYRLLNAGCDDTARLLYSTMDSLSDPDSGASLNKGLFYVKHLIARDKPLSAILSMCEDVSGDNVHLLQRSLEVAFTRNPKLVYPLMDAIQAKGANLRPHYFWPLIARCAQVDDSAGVYEVLENMKTRGTPVTMATMLDYALPALMRDSVQFTDVVSKLGRAGASLGDAANAIARFLVRRGDLAGAVQLLQTYRFRLAPHTRRDLAIATVRTRDYWSAAALLGEVRVGRDPNLPAEEDGDDDAAAQLGEEQGDGDAMPQQNEDVVGRFLLDVNQRAGSFGEDFDWVALLTAVKDRGLSISKEFEAKLSHLLGGRATAEVNELLSALASGNLSKVQLDRRTQFFSVSKKSVEELEAALENSTASGRDPKPILTNLLVAYCKADKVEKAQEVLKTLEETHQYPLGVGLRVYMINMYYNLNMAQPAFDMYEKIREMEPDVTLTSKAILRLASLYVNADRTEDAAVFLEAEAKKRHASEDEYASPEGKDLFSESVCDRILAPSSDSGDVEMVTRLVRAILDGKFAAPCRRLFNPIVRAHLAKGDVESAWSSVVECKRNYNIIPFRKGIARELIKREDTNKLQQLVDMTTELYGEHSSLFSLASCFLEEGRVKEAKRILETPGLRVRSENLSEECQYYVRAKEAKRLEDLLVASAEVSSIDRRIIYQNLLEAYINDGNCDKALGLWTQMQEEDLPIPDLFLQDLGTFLQQNDKPVPFAIPEKGVGISSPRAQEQPRPRQRVRQPREMVRAPEEKHPKVLEFLKLTDDGKLDEALSLYNELLAANDRTLVISSQDSLAIAGKLFDADRLDDAIQIFKKSHALRPRNTFGYVLLRKIGIRLAELGDFDGIEDLIDFGYGQDGRSLSLNFCKAAENSNQGERCFNKFEKLLDETSPGDVRNISRIFSPSGFVQLMQKDASLLTRLEDLSDKMKSKGLMDGVRTLWAHHFIEGNTQKVEELSKELKKNDALAPYIPVLHHCRNSQDVAAAENLLAYMKADTTTDYKSAMAETYCCVIDILCAKNSPREALAKLGESLQSVKLEALKIDSLKTLSQQLAAENIAFPYEIPANSKAPTASSSA